MARCTGMHFAIGCRESPVSLFFRCNGHLVVSIDYEWPCLFVCLHADRYGRMEVSCMA
jgi:hypothetical protein